MAHDEHCGQGKRCCCTLQIYFADFPSLEYVCTRVFIDDGIYLKPRHPRGAGGAVKYKRGGCQGGDVTEDNGSL